MALFLGEEERFFCLVHAVAKLLQLTILRCLVQALRGLHGFFGQLHAFKGGPDHLISLFLPICGNFPMCRAQLVL